MQPPRKGCAEFSREADAEKDLLGEAKEDRHCPCVGGLGLGGLEYLSCRDWSPQHEAAPGVKHADASRQDPLAMFGEAQGS